MYSSMFSSYKSIIKTKNYEQTSIAAKQLQDLIDKSLEQVNVNDTCKEELKNVLLTVQKCINNIKKFHNYIAKLDPEIIEQHQKSITTQNALIYKGNIVVNKITSLLVEHDNAVHEYTVLIATAAAATAMLQSKKTIEQIIDITNTLQIAYDKISVMHDKLNDGLHSVLGINETSIILKDKLRN